MAPPWGHLCETAAWRAIIRHVHPSIEVPREQRYSLLLINWYGTHTRGRPWLCPRRGLGKPEQFDLQAVFLGGDPIICY
jgi:hypothetical protein